MDARKILLAAATLAFFSSFNSSPASAQTQSYSLGAVLLGGNECDTVPPPAVVPVCRQGDMDGFGRATITFPTATSLCVTLQVDNLAGVTLAHIHPGRETFNGAPVLILSAPIAPGGGNPGNSVTCVAVPPAGLIAAMRANPANFYINVHTAAFPNGALRGQLF
jgi:hypothetical protein